MSNLKSTARREFLQRSSLLLAGGSLLDTKANNSAAQSMIDGKAARGRINVPLGGTWQIDESVAAEEIPQSFPHSGPVPGMANLATPPFPDVDAFISPENIRDRRAFKVEPESEIAKIIPGPQQKRNHFWYHRTFRVPAKREVAILKVNKAQFGTAVWLNEKKIGDHYGCFTAGYFNVTEAMNWEGDNRLLVRIGAHPWAVPRSVPTGIDFEKNKWTPGIYDEVSLRLCDNPVIETLQVAPRIDPCAAVVQTRIKNYGGACSFVLAHQVKTWKGQQAIAESRPQSLRLESDEERTLTETIPLPGAELWSPENPFLYELETSTGGDSVSTRFGVREFRFETATKRAYLNGKIYFLRGSNITLHRFFDDPQCRNLPWDESWVRKLLIDIPKRMHWNSFRFCIGPVPDKWLDIADEAGLLIQNEYFIWSYHDEYDTKEVIEQYKEWMRDNWNHPSVVIWDACNETHAEIIPNTIIPAVRTLDLSDRPWENSYNLPSGPNDPVEDHPYLFSAFSSGRSFNMVELEKMTGAKSLSSPHPTGHAVILNEYGWLWLRRDGIPTPVTKPVYDSLLGPQATPEERFELDAYLLAGLTEFWRAHRNCAGVLHFVYLSSGYPGVYTSDHFKDIEKLVLEPHFEDYVGEAFKPLGVYINFWRPNLNANSQKVFDVMMVNDLPKPSHGKLVLALESIEGKQVVATEAPFTIPSLGQMTYRLYLAIPRAPGKYLLKAAAHAETEGQGPTISRRKVSIEVSPPAGN